MIWTRPIRVEWAPDPLRANQSSPWGLPPRTRARPPPAGRSAGGDVGLRPSVAVFPTVPGGSGVCLFLGRSERPAEPDAAFEAAGGETGGGRSPEAPLAGLRRRQLLGFPPGFP